MRDEFNDAVRFVIRDLKNFRFSAEITVSPFFENLDFHPRISHKFYVATEENYVATQHSESTMKNTQTLSRHRISLLRQRKLEVEVNVVTTKTIIVATESEENDKKIVATQKRML